MNKLTALRLLSEYKQRHTVMLHGYCESFPENGSEKKAMRWLGFVQGMLVAHGIYRLAEVKEHSRYGRVRKPWGKI